MSYRRFTGTRLVVASHNPGKVREIGELIRPYGVEAISAGSLGLPEPEETGDTFAQNAELKALAAASQTDLAALSDDSGLVVNCLDGAPGIYSARWAGPKKDFAFAMKRVQEEVAAKGIDKPRAHFTCALTLAWPDAQFETFEGQVHGHLEWPPRGDKGFGYDPIFVADGYKVTFGEMDQAEKHRISHRARAFAKLIEACFANAR